MNSKSKFLISIGLLGLLCVMLPISVRAQTIVGPPLTNDSSGYDYSGIGFTANVNSSLTSFTFQNEGSSDTVILVNPSGTTLDFVSIPASTPSDTVSVNWALTAGDQYYLLQSTNSNSLFADWGLTLPSNIQITLTDSGVFSSSPNSADFDLGGAAGNGGLYWAAFNNITTSSTSVTPEPPNFFLCLGGIILLSIKAFRAR
jgi:hypothetical protein